MRFSPGCGCCGCCDPEGIPETLYGVFSVTDAGTYCTCWDGVEVTLTYTGESGGFHVWSGTATIECDEIATLITVTVKTAGDCNWKVFVDSSPDCTVGVISCSPFHFAMIWTSPSYYGCGVTTLGPSCTFPVLDTTSSLTLDVTAA